MVHVKANKPTICTIDVSTKESSYEQNSSSSDDSKSRYHRSDNYSRYQRYEKWMVTKDTAKYYQNGNNDLLAVVAK